MNTQSRLITIAAAFLTGLFVTTAAEKKIEAGPKGGRLLEKTAPKAEFFVEKDRTVSIHFYDDNLQSVPAGNQQVTLIAESKGGKTRIEFERKDGRLISKAPLPEGDGYNVVVMFKAREDIKSQNFRFALDLHNCGGCQRAEYACTCGH